MSSKLAKWYHSMTFTYASEWDSKTKKHGTVNTWDDWHLVPTSRPVFQQGAVKTNYVDIPGADGQLDLTEALTDYPTYQNREGSLEFIVMNGYRQNWAGGFSKFANWLHGKLIRVVLDDDPNFFYEGRLSLNEWNSNNDGTWSNVTIDYNLKPYKFYRFMSNEKWLWDPFNFETDIIHDVTKYTIDGPTTITIPIREMHVIPTFVITGTNDTTWKFNLNGTTLDLAFDITAQNSNEVRYRDPRLELLSGDNSLLVIPQTNGNLEIIFREGSL